MADSALPPDDYFVLGGSEPDEMVVSYRLAGDELDPEHITRLTGIQPETAYRKGDDPPGDAPRPRPRRFGMWSVSSETGLPRGGTVVEDHLVPPDQPDRTRSVR